MTLKPYTETLMDPRNIHMEDYTYELPDNRIARYPLTDRQKSKLLIYANNLIREDIFKNLDQHLPQTALLLFNDTKVIQARLFFRKPSGGQVEIFCLEPDADYADIHTAMQQTGEVQWNCMVGGAGKWKPGTILTLPFAGDVLQAAAVQREGSTFKIIFRWSDPAYTFAEVLELAGKVPLPPYLQRAAEKQDKISYQTVYATEEGSVAAPTAGLHFTGELLEDLRRKGVTTGFITLHVGAGTFKPVKADKLAGHEMHEEWFSVDRDLILKIREHKAETIAVGTTTLRTLESLYHIGRKIFLNPDIKRGELQKIEQWEAYAKENRVVSRHDALGAVLDWMDRYQQQHFTARTKILIAPGYTFRMAEGLITNFHQPGSTLLLLIAAATGEAWRSIYAYALENHFRFLSYGDSSLLWIKDARTPAENHGKA